MMAIPAFMRARRDSQAARFIQDLRVAVDAFSMYNMDNGSYPPDRTPGVMPPGMEDYLRGIRWTEPTPIGGQWDWEYNVFDVTAGVSVYQPNRSHTEMQEIAERIDNGSLSSGQFQSRPDRYMYIIEF